MAVGFFQKRIDEIINNVVGADDGASLTAEQLTQLSSELALYFSGFLLVLAGILLVAVFVIWIFSKRGNSSSTANKELERQHLLQDLETQFISLSTQPAVWLTSRDNYDAKVVYEFSLALTAEVGWNVPKTVKISWHMGDRLVAITEKQDFLTASVLEEVLFWFRRLDRAVASGIIQVEDIYDLWRQILPFAVDNRFGFMTAFFAEDNQNELENIKAIQQVLIGIIRYCQQQKKTQPLSYLYGRLDPVFFNALPKGMKPGLEAAKQHKTKPQSPLMADDTQASKTKRKEPLVIDPEKIPENTTKTTRKEPTVSFENVDIETKKPN